MSPSATMRSAAAASSRAAGSGKPLRHLASRAAAPAPAPAPTLTMYGMEGSAGEAMPGAPELPWPGVPSSGVAIEEPAASTS
eukprot:scaffold3826_cov78-Phaeocystis_antarctica.AAC.5